MKRIIKNPVMMYILGIITCTLTTVLASSLLASDITYKPKDKSWGVTNVQAAIDSLKLAKTSDNYSTNERVVGTWIDGKPLYQKTIRTTTPLAANSGTDVGFSYLPIGASVDYGFVVDMYVTTSDGQVLPTFYANNSMSSFVKSVVMINSASNNQNTVCIAAKGFEGLPAVVTIRYTKTTD